MPLLVSVVIVPKLKFNTPAPPEKPTIPVPPLIVPALLSVVIAPEFDTPAPPKPPPAFPPLIVAPVALASEPIVAPLRSTRPRRPRRRRPNRRFRR